MKIRHRDWFWLGWKNWSFEWGTFRYNSGNPYLSYRFGPLFIRAFVRFK